MTQLILGFGEIGKAVYEVVSGRTQAGDIYISDPTFTKEKTPVERPEIMHVCFPYSNEFSHELRNYIDRYNPKHIVVWSTVPIHTCEDISPRVVHSPVEGKHPELELSIRQMERWIGYNDAQEGQFFANFFSSCGLRTKLVPATSFTEALKLLSTTEYGLNIVFADYKAKVADSLGMDYELVKEWNVEYNKLYRNLGMDKRFQKYVLDPPSGRIGGHCVVPNAAILKSQFPDSLLDRIINQGEEL